MRQVGTSHGGAGGFGAEEDALGGFGDRSGGRSGGQGGVGLGRDGRDEGRGRDHGLGGRGAEARARAFRDRMDDARHRLGRGAGEGERRDSAEPAGADSRASAPPFGGIVQASGRDAGENGGSGGGGFPTERHRAIPDADLPDGPAGAPAILRGAEALGDGASRRLLAAAEPPADALAALFAFPAPTAAPAGAGAPTSEPGAPAAVERRIADIADRVERALAADLAADPAAPIALRIPLDGAGGGLTSLTVTATAQGLDITLARPDGEAAASPELLQAAQGLAERLQRRLGRGSVRVFADAEASETSRPAEGGWAGLSAILGRGTG